MTGTVASIASAPTDASSDVVTYKVEVVFDAGERGVKGGMSADASIRVDRHENVIQVPNRAIKTQGPFKTVQVLYGQGKAPVDVRVETGATNGQMTEIVKCLDTGSQCLRPGDQVAINVPTATANGQQDSGPNNQFVTFGGPGGGPGGGIVVEGPGPGGKP